jgi:His-Xaa-Ser system radical SAM maturase HxsC
MILSDKADRRWNAAPFVVRVSTDPSRPEPLRQNEVLLLRSTCQSYTPGFRAYFSTAATFSELPHGVDAPLISLPETLSYLGDGDIVIVRPSTGDLRVLYRRTAVHNSFLVTQACNSFCMMCAQPPSKHTADDCAELLWDAIPLMNINTPEVTLTGGEPTLLGRKLVELIRRIKNFLPHTSLHVLSNGRLIKSLAFAQDVAEICHPDLVFGIPLYSDVSHEHDFIVQASGAFDEAVKGILNLARCGLRVEIRFVITRLNYKSLQRFAGFVARNLTFSCNVALMGMEPVGFAKSNLASVWMDPADYSEYLAAAVRILESQRLPVSIYNHQLCTISPDLWRYARQSISDWKNVFIDTCEGCAVKHQCCGFFASGVNVHSTSIKPVRST